MSINDAAIYLRTLRELREMSQSDVGEQIGVLAKTVLLNETGQTKPKAGTLTAWLHAVGGTHEDYETLLAPTATTEDAREMARQRFERANVPTGIRARLAPLHTAPPALGTLERLADLLPIFGQLDEAQQARVIEYATLLAESRDRQFAAMQRSRPRPTKDDEGQPRPTPNT